MPDETHLRTLLSGPDGWDEWRIRNPGLAPDLRAARLQGRKLKGMDLSGADFRYATLDDADLSGADLRDARVELASLKEARLVRVSLDRARLAGANLEGADLSEASLVSADLRQTNLDRARLLNVDLRFAVLTRTKLHTADVSGCWIEDTVFAGCDLSRTAGLESLRHRGRSTISVETILLSRGIIPDTCLRNVGLPEALLTNRYALLDIMRPIQFQSCFISYSAKDQEFAERLHADLQAVGVRVWFAPEDLKIGDEFRSQIERSISSYDRLLLVLSQNSIASSWVQSEVEAAFEQEQKRRTIVLFPIRLDTAIMETDTAWAATVRRTRHIGDFAQWKDHDLYRKSFRRLLRDIEAIAAEQFPGRHGISP